MGLAFAPPSLLGKWDTPQGLRLALVSGGRFAMGSSSIEELFAGMWVQRGDTVVLSSTTLRGKPIKAALRGQLAPYASGMAPARRAAFLAPQLKELSPTLQVERGGKELTWHRNGQATVFTPARKRPIAFTEAELAKGLRKGMAKHEVGAFFRENPGETRSVSGDPPRMLSTYHISIASKPRTVLATYLYQKGVLGLERVDLLGGGGRRRIAIL